MAVMRIVRAMMIGDVVGEPGLQALEENLPGMIRDNAVDFTAVNGENSSDGFGMTEAALNRIIACGADAVTSGNHIWEKREFWPTLGTVEAVLRPANYPPGLPGRGWLCKEKSGVNWIVINIQGRDLITSIDCPFRIFDDIIQKIDPATPSPIVLVDFHAETSREKESLGYYVDGRAGLVAGTHTHVQTADERLLPGGTAYITDLGMTGITDSVIGMDTKICLDRMTKQVLYRMEPAALPMTLSATLPAASSEAAGVEVQGVIAEFDADSGKALSVRRI